MRAPILQHSIVSAHCEAVPILGQYVHNPSISFDPTMGLRAISEVSWIATSVGVDVDGAKTAPIFVALSFVTYHQATPACLLGLLDACISPLSFLSFLLSCSSRPHARELNPSSLAHCPSVSPYHRATLFAGTRYTIPLSHIPTYS